VVMWLPVSVPQLSTAIVALLSSRRHAGALAYISGSLGTPIGADLLDFNTVRGLGAPVASVGGAGTFGIFLTGILGVLLAVIFGRAMVRKAARATEKCRPAALNCSQFRTPSALFLAVTVALPVSGQEGVSCSAAKSADCTYATVAGGGEPRPIGGSRCREQQVPSIPILWHLPGSRVEMGEARQIDPRKVPFLGECVFRPPDRRRAADC